MPQPETVRQLIGTSCQIDGSATALLSPERTSLSYAELSEQVDYVGHALRRLGVQRNERVALVMPNGPEMAAAFLGTAAFATCAPLNPEFRDSEFEFFLADLQPKAIILSDSEGSAARSVAERLGIAVVDLSASTDQAGNFRFVNLAVEPVAVLDPGQADDIALLLHTSGTTSRPKLVPLSHQNLCASAQNIGDVLQLARTDRCLNVMPLFHIHGLVGVLLSSIASGASVVCSPGFQNHDFFASMKQFEPTWYSAVPTIHQAILNHVRDAEPLNGATSLRLIRSSSSSLPPSVMAELESTFQVPVIESYGMTEAAHQMSSNPLPPRARKAGSVGLPAGPDMGIMDEEGNLLTGDASGEIVIRGNNVTAGYADNADADAFMNGWFRTGDLGYFDEHGYLFLSGRKKEMINRGGENVSPREIDEVLLEHDAVQQAVAFAVPHPSLGEDVAAAVVLRPEATADENELRRFAFDRLAPFKVPSRVVMVAAIPKGPTGKLQRIGLDKALREELGVTNVAPSNDLEQGVVDAFEKILQTASVGVNENFFALGGDSIKATRVIAQLSLEFHVDLPAVSLFLNPTAKELAMEITQLLAEDSGMLEEILKEIEGMTEGEAADISNEQRKV